MIGRLLQTAASTLTPHNASRPPTPLESVAEEAHTHSLLYPDLNTLRQVHDPIYAFHHGNNPATAEEAANFDDRGGVGVEYPRNIRIIIAQDANARYQQPQVLFDSKLPKNAERHNDLLLRAEGAASPRGPHVQSPLQSPLKAQHSRRSSLFQSPQTSGPSPTSPRSLHFGLAGAFSENSLRMSNTEPEPDHHETTQGRVAREGKEETEALLDCMFGAPGFRLEPSTKLHVLPRGPSNVTRNTDESPTIPRPSSSREFSRKKTPLTRSTSAADMSGEASAANRESSQEILKVSRASIVITRMFAIDLPESRSNVEHESVKGVSGKGDFPLHEVYDSVGKTKPNQKKTPMFAVAVILQLPSDRQPPRTPVPPSGGLAFGFPAANHLSQSISPTDLRPNVNNQSGSALAQLNKVDSDVDSRIAHVLAHWNVILRATESLETIARTRLRSLLESLGPNQMQFLPPPSNPRIDATKPKKPKQSFQQSIQVDPGCLQLCGIIQKAAEATARRIIDGLRTRRVITGQGRWGAWREEARWVGQWAGGRDQNFFFFNLLTAFLGCHTAWLDTIGPTWHRRRHASRQPIRRREGGLIQQRTIIISSNKMAARRLIFLLSAFLPTARILPDLEALQWPFTINAQSPPSVPVTRNQSLRRTINKRPRGSLRGGTDASNHGRSVSFSLQDPAGGLEREQVEHQLGHGHGRHVSDARSIKSTALSIPSNGVQTRKASTSTLVANAAVPVPHFSNSRSDHSTGGAAEPRPGSSGSLASLALSHTLQRSESAALSNTSGSNGRWGSMISGFWSNRRGSSTDESDMFASSQEGLGIVGAATSNTGELARMVEETAGYSTTKAQPQVNGLDQDPSSSTIIRNPALLEGKSSPEDATPAKDIPERPKSEHDSIKFSIDETDGAIDIDLPAMSSLSSSLTSSFGSLRFGHTAASSFQEHFAPYGRPSTPDSHRARSDPPVDVAGWLKTYHQDFILQAVRPYGTLKENVKRSMREEASLIPSTDEPGMVGLSDGKWMDICTTLVADTTNFSIHRLRLRRRLKRVGDGSLQANGPASNIAFQNHHDEPSIQLYDEDIIEEPIMDMDSTLIDAVERVIARSGHSSCVESRAHSRGPSPSRSGSSHREHTHTMEPALEIPRSECRKTVLGALEQVVRSVTAEQPHSEHGGKGHGVNGHGGRDKDGNGEDRVGRNLADSTLREGVRKWLHEVEET
ncbi:hypothetical protein MMC24_006933 [Lignoscripta atroalba]|nr:hypothetical protein [Lignoscripta atroalba]